MREPLGYWELPKPFRGEEKEWHVVARTSSTIPFGYKIKEDNESLLEPVPEELEALELAKRHIKQYSYREVARWLSKETGRYISYEGLKKRIAIEYKRKKAASIKRQLAKRLEKALQEIEKLEERGIGAYRIRSRD
jgi:Iap family predicted aminopeptidase